MLLSKGSFGVVEWGLFGLLLVLLDPVESSETSQRFFMKMSQKVHVRCFWLAQIVAVLLRQCAFHYLLQLLVESRLSPKRLLLAHPKGIHHLDLRSCQALYLMHIS
jgi:hypothetical protein